MGAIGGDRVPILLVPGVGIDWRNSTGDHICASAGISGNISEAELADASILGPCRRVGTG